MQTSHETTYDATGVQTIQTIFGTVRVYEFHPALHGDRDSSPYLVVDVDTTPVVDRLVKVYVDDEPIFTGEVPA